MLGFILGSIFIIITTLYSFSLIQRKDFFYNYSKYMKHVDKFNKENNPNWERIK